MKTVKKMKVVKEFEGKFFSLKTFIAFIAFTAFMLSFWISVSVVG